MSSDPVSAPAPPPAAAPAALSYEVDRARRPTVDGAPKGCNVSGRNWKVRPQKRATKLVATKYNNRSKTWEKRQEQKRLRALAIEKENAMKEIRRLAAVEKKERILEQDRRRAENEFRASMQSAQQMTSNVGLKVKAMSKKQLRQIKKTRMNTRTGVVEFVPAYAKEGPRRTAVESVGGDGPREGRTDACFFRWGAVRGGDGARGGRRKPPGRKEDRHTFSFFVGNK
eukprot:CAMPEP_0194274872 /NCGR_PEP_ID=MMETSP0169-20130528/7860_1 /TAXON_ID=218684 /ORGANISM="Corethron pennatum, Strain L29A3" /LENGTH=226 /DNA_ID=CAMNT_0039018203 /DNA_START=175 /DNA_END=856 /DNA_ORIENTATION=+